MTKETNNVCNMPSILELELHKSDDTGHYYINLIHWLDKKEDGAVLPEHMGSWTDKKITKKQVKELVKFINSLPTIKYDWEDDDD